jgi:putative regulator of septum formation
MLRVMVAALLLAGLAGCSGPAPEGVDGDLTDGWAMLPAAEPFRPKIGECFENLVEVAAMDDHRPVDCGELHVAETFFVGEGPDEPVAPTGGSAAMHAAYADCSGRAVTFLGGPWREARIVVRAVWPSRQGWAGGARWFRCDVAQADLDGSSDTSRTGSLAGTLTADSGLRLGCFNPKVNSDAVRTMTAIACTKTHAAEFAGLWTAPDIPYAEQIRDRDRSAAGCRSAIARFTGVPDDDDVQYRSGWISYNPTRTEWQQGERRVRCFLWFRGGKLTRSLAGAGPSALPVR